MIRRLLLLTGLLALCHVPAGCAASSSPPPEPPAPRVEHVLLIGLDGARADAIRDHAGPALRGLIAGGTSCWSAQAERPSVTQVNWASILTGSTPAVHGIDRHPVTEAELAGKRVKVQTVLEAIAKRGGTAAGFLGHWKLHPSESTADRLTIIRSPYESRTVAPRAAAYIEQHKPTFCFVYFGDLDGLGHRNGWMSEPYLAGINQVDAGVKTLLDALDRAGLRDKTLIIVTSDHGGSGKSHSAGTPEDRTVPLILNGPGIPAGKEINLPVSVTAIAPTVLQQLKLPIPPTWDGKPLDLPR